MSLPAKLLYNNKINSSYARNFNSTIQAQNTSNYGLGQTAIFNIPCMRNQVLSGADTLLSLKLRTRNGAVANTSGWLPKGGIAHAIQRLRIFSGSQLLCDIDNYGNLVSMLTAWQSSTEHVSGKLAALQGCGSGRGLQVFSGAILANAANADYDFCFPLLSILSLTDNYVPLYAMSGNGPLRLELQFVGGFPAFIGTTEAITNSADGANTVFSDCKLIANFVELSDAAMAIVEQSTSGGPVQWVCQSFSNYVFNGTLRNAVTQLSIPVPAKFNSLKALYMTMRRNPDGADNALPDDCSKFLLSQYTTRIGSRVIPSEPPTTVPQFIAEMHRALGSASSRIDPTSYSYVQVRTDAAVDIANTTYSGCFAIGVETESYSSAPMGSVYQGLNTSTDDIFIQPSFAAQGADTNVRFDIYASYDQLITIDQGVVTVQY